MDNENCFSWIKVRNTVAERLKDDSLMHTCSTKVKVSKRTKYANKLFSQIPRYQQYHHFIRDKEEAIKNCPDNEDVTDDEVVGFKDIGTANLRDNVDYNQAEISESLDECFQWICVEKDRLKEWKDEDFIHSSNVERQIHTRQSRVKINQRQSTASEVESGNDYDDRHHETEPEEDLPLVSRSKNNSKKNPPKKVQKKEVDKKSPENVKKNLSYEINNIPPKPSAEEDEWNGDFIPNDFQAQSTQIFSESLTENTRARRSTSLRQLPAHKEFNQPKDSGIDEEDDGKCKSTANNLKNKQPLKIIGEEKLDKKYKIVQHEKRLKPVVEEVEVSEHKSIQKQKNADNDELTNSLDATEIVEESSDNCYDLYEGNDIKSSNKGSDSDSNSNVENKSVNKKDNLLATLRKKLTESNSPLLRKQYETLKQMRILQSGSSINETDLDSNTDSKSYTEETKKKTSLDNNRVTANSKKLENKKIDKEQLDSEKNSTDINTNDKLSVAIKNRSDDKINVNNISLDHSVQESIGELDLTNKIVDVESAKENEVEENIGLSSANESDNDERDNTGSEIVIEDEEKSKKKKKIRSKKKQEPRKYESSSEESDNEKCNRSAVHSPRRKKGKDKDTSVDKRTSDNNENNCVSDVDIEEHKIQLPDECKKLDLMKSSETSDTAIQMKNKMSPSKLSPTKSGNTPQEVDVEECTSESETFYGKDESSTTEQSKISKKTQLVNDGSSQERLKQEKHIDNIQSNDKNIDDDEEFIKKESKKPLEKVTEEVSNPENGPDDLQEYIADDIEGCDQSILPSLVEKLSQCKNLNLLDDNSSSDEDKGNKRESKETRNEPKTPEKSVLTQKPANSSDSDSDKSNITKTSKKSKTPEKSVLTQKPANSSDSDSDKSSISKTSKKSITPEKSILTQKPENSSHSDSDKSSISKTSKKSITPEKSILTQKPENSSDSDSGKSSIFKTSKKSKTPEKSVLTQKQENSRDSDSDKSSISKTSKKSKTPEKSVLTQKPVNSRDSDSDKSIKSKTSKKSDSPKKSVLTQKPVNSSDSDSDKSSISKTSKKSDSSEKTILTQKSEDSSDSDSNNCNVTKTSKKSKTPEKSVLTEKQESLSDSDSSKSNISKKSKSPEKSALTQKPANTSDSDSDESVKSKASGKSVAESNNIVVNVGDSEGSKKEIQEPAKEIIKNLASQDLFSSMEFRPEQIDEDNLNSNAVLGLNDHFDTDSQEIPLNQEQLKKKQLKSITDLVERDNLSENDNYEATMTSNLLYSLNDHIEIFLVTIPKYVFDTDLTKKKFSYSKTTLRLGDDKYKAIQKEKNPKLTCVVKTGKSDKNTFRAYNIRPAVSIVAKRRKDSDDDETSNENLSEGTEDSEDDSSVSEKLHVTKEPSNVDSSSSSESSNENEDVKNTPEKIDGSAKPDKENISNATEERKNDRTAVTLKTPEKIDKVEVPTVTKNKAKTVQKAKVVKNKFTLDNFAKKTLRKNKDDPPPEIKQISKSEEPKENKTPKKNLSKSFDDAVQQEVHHETLEDSWNINPVKKTLNKKKILSDDSDTDTSEKTEAKQVKVTQFSKNSAEKSRMDESEDFSKLLNWISSDSGEDEAKKTEHTSECKIKKSDASKPKSKSKTSEKTALTPKKSNLSKSKNSEILQTTNKAKKTSDKTANAQILLSDKKKEETNNLDGKKVKNKKGKSKTSSVISNDKILKSTSEPQEKDDKNKTVQKSKPTKNKISIENFAKKTPRKKKDDPPSEIKQISKNKEPKNSKNCKKNLSASFNDPIQQVSEDSWDINTIQKPSNKKNVISSDDSYNEPEEKQQIATKSYDTDDSDKSISPSQSKKLMQFKKLNLLNNSDSTSEDEVDKGKFKISDALSKKSDSPTLSDKYKMAIESVVNQGKANYSDSDSDEFKKLQSTSKVTKPANKKALITQTTDKNTDNQKVKKKISLSLKIKSDPPKNVNSVKSNEKQKVLNDSSETLKQKLKAKKKTGDNKGESSKKLQSKLQELPGNISSSSEDEGDKMKHTTEFKTKKSDLAKNQEAVEKKKKKSKTSKKNLVETNSEKTPNPVSSTKSLNENSNVKTLKRKLEEIIETDNEEDGGPNNLQSEDIEIDDYMSDYASKKLLQCKKLNLLDGSSSENEESKTNNKDNVKKKQAETKSVSLNGNGKKLKRKLEKKNELIIPKKKLKKLTKPDENKIADVVEIIAENNNPTVSTKKVKSKNKHRLETAVHVEGPVKKKKKIKEQTNYIDLEVATTSKSTDNVKNPNPVAAAVADVPPKKKKKKKSPDFIDVEAETSSKSKDEVQHLDPVAAVDTDTSIKKKKKKKNKPLSDCIDVEAETSSKPKNKVENLGPVAAVDTDTSIKKKKKKKNKPLSDCIDVEAETSPKSKNKVENLGPVAAVNMDTAAKKKKAKVQSDYVDLATETTSKPKDKLKKKKEAANKPTPSKPKGSPDIKPAKPKNKNKSLMSLWNADSSDEDDKTFATQAPCVQEKTKYESDSDEKESSQPRTSAFFDQPQYNRDNVMKKKKKKKKKKMKQSVHFDE